MIDKIKLSFGAYRRQKFAVTLKGSQQLSSFYKLRGAVRPKSEQDLLDYKPTLEHGHGFYLAFLVVALPTNNPL